MSATWAQKVGYPRNTAPRIPHKKIATAIDELIQEVTDRADRVGLIVGSIPQAYLAGQYTALVREVKPYIGRGEYQKLADHIVQELERPLSRPGWYHSERFRTFPSLHYTAERGKRKALLRALVVLERYIPSLSLPDYRVNPCETPERTEPHDMLEYPQAKRIGRKLAARSGKKRYIFNTPTGICVSRTPPTNHNGYVIAKPNGDFVFIRPDWQYPNDKNRVERVEHPRYTKFGW